jgi:hypothetical protein
MTIISMLRLPNCFRSKRRGLSGSIVAEASRLMALEPAPAEFTSVVRAFCTTSLCHQDARGVVQRPDSIDTRSKGLPSCDCGRSTTFFSPRHESGSQELQDSIEHPARFRAQSGRLTAK